MAGVAVAHPHVLVEARSELVFEGSTVKAVRHVWRFDRAFTAFAIQGLDADGNGKLSDDELKPLAKLNVESLKDYESFTFLHVGDTKAAFQDAEEYWLDFSDGRLTLFFTLELAKPLPLENRQLTLEVFDPTYFIAFSMTETDPFVLSDAAEGCKLNASFAKEPDDETAARLAEIPQDVREIPQEFLDVTQTLSNTAIVECS